MSSRLSATLSALLFLIAPSHLVVAQQEQAAVRDAGSEKTEPGEEGLDAIRQSADAFVEAFGRADARALSQLWTPDGEFVDELGTKHEGREAIAKAYEDFFAANPKATLRLSIDSLKRLSDDAALEDGHAFVESAGNTSTVGQYSVVHVMVDGKWLMASVRDSRVETDASRENLADLDWLIGTWVAEENGAKTESVCRWLGDKCFVERSYKTRSGDGAETTGVQIIGWNAQEGHVQSWNFSPDGSFAVGVWSPVENGWQAALTGVTTDGAPTTAVNQLIRLDDNAYSWQSVHRSLGDEPLPDTSEVVIRRNPQK